MYPKIYTQYLKLRKQVGVVLTFGLCIIASHSASAAYQVGDIFAAVGAGQIKRFSPDGTLLQTLDTTSGSLSTAGMCFDSLGNLYSTNFSSQNMTKFDNDGVIIAHPWATGFGDQPESCVVDGVGNIYTGEVDGAQLMRKFDSTGGAPLVTFAPTTGDRGIDWIDLAGDQCTMYYTSEGSLVKRFDVCTDTQLPDFTSGLNRPCFALRIRSNGEVMVACRSEVVRLNATGGIIQIYPATNYPNASNLFALNLDPDNSTFWTGDLQNGNIFRIDIETGSLVTTFNAGIVGVGLGGLAIFGELTVSQAADLSISTDSPDPVNSGQILTYNLTVTNNGPNGAEFVTVTDTLPNNVTLISAIPSQGMCNEAASIVTCDLGSLAFSTVTTIAIQVVPTTFFGNLTNIANVSSSTSDPDSNNNATTTTTTMGQTPPLQNTCDVNGDSFINRTDISAIFLARNTPASGSDDPRDADGDTTITVNDVRACVLRCDLPVCQ